MNKELSCEDCGESFEIYSDSDSDVCFCPFCGTELIDKEDFEEQDDSWDDQDNTRF